MTCDTGFLHPRLTEAALGYCNLHTIICFFSTFENKKKGAGVIFFYFWRMSDVSRTRLITGEKLTKGTAQQQRTARTKLTRTKTVWCFLFLAKTKKERNPKTHHLSMCLLVSPIRCGMRHTLVALPSERAPLREPRASSRRHAKNGAAAPAHHHRLAVREHRGDLEATLTLDVHEEAVGALYKSLQLVLLLLHVRRRVQ